eukprot:TRINITY_DN1492_c0_g1_i1.p1 TRINITY_DN1492_c0_g1~~TRINITY_DN1492_c0_g1_i1.p1  ORF type:complete len:139 (+),score=28.68 TRINITY_DN1492_c0_g1_i1:260-676(+)
MGEEQQALQDRVLLLERKLADQTSLTEQLQAIIKEKERVQKEAEPKMQLEMEIRIKEAELWVKGKLLELADHLKQDFIEKELMYSQPSISQTNEKRLTEALHLVNLVISDQNQVESKLQKFSDLVSRVEKTSLNAPIR